MNRNDVIDHLQIIRTWAAVGKDPIYQGIEPKCCEDVEKWIDEALALLKEQEARELSMDEWREWKANPNRNPICELWENDTSPIWVLYPNNVSELALLMGKLKLFTGKPTLEQCKAVKWDE